MLYKSVIIVISFRHPSCLQRYLIWDFLVFVKEKERSKTKQRTNWDEIGKEGRRSGWYAEKIQKGKAACWIWTSNGCGQQKRRSRMVTSQPDPPPQKWRLHLYFRLQQDLSQCYVKKIASFKHVEFQSLALFSLSQTPQSPPLLKLNFWFPMPINLNGISACSLTSLFS